jgi:hypothetical protein
MDKEELPCAASEAEEGLFPLAIICLTLLCLALGGGGAAVSTSS